jgi:hypothetical protein
LIDSTKIKSLTKVFDALEPKTRQLLEDAIKTFDMKASILEGCWQDKMQNSFRISLKTLEGGRLDGSLNLAFKDEKSFSMKYSENEYTATLKDDGRLLWSAPVNNQDTWINDQDTWIPKDHAQVNGNAVTSSWLLPKHRAQVKLLDSGIVFGSRHKPNLAKAEIVEDGDIVLSLNKKELRRGEKNWDGF